MLRISSLPPTPQAGVPPRVDSLRLFMQSARSYPPYTTYECFLSIRNLKTRLTVVTRILLTWQLAVFARYYIGINLQLSCPELRCWY